jgi:hypothetical protein
MKTSLIIILLLLSRLSFSQDTTVTWIKNIDTSSFKIIYNKKSIPKEFYRILEIKKIEELANSTDKYTPSCKGLIRGQFHWMARQKDYWVISVTYGGKTVGTRYLFLDKNESKLNINEINFNLPRFGMTSFGQIVSEIRLGQYEFEKFYPERFIKEEN